MDTMTEDRAAGAGKCPHSAAEVDLFEPGAQDYWFEAYEVLHEQAPVCRIPNGGDRPGTDAFILTKYEDVRRVVQDLEGFPVASNEAANGLREVEAEVIGSSGFADAINATRTLRPDLEGLERHRKELTDPWVGPSGVPQHREMITQVANELLDRFIDQGQVEFVEQFAAPLPQTVITTILGFPLQDMPMLRQWEAAQVRRFVYGRTHRNLLSEEEERDNAKALVAFHEYIQEQIDRKREQPGKDMISALIDIKYGPEQRRLTDGEISSVVYGMHIGGNETTQYALTAQALVLAQDPDLFAMLRENRSKVPLFIEEALRLYAPTQGQSSRRAAKDVNIRGVDIPAGSLIHVRFGAANRDPETFTDPDRVDLRRPNLGRHLTFSQGLRRCPGSALSRLEQNIAIHVLLDRLDSLSLAPGRNSLRRQPGIMLGIESLHLDFTRR